jgi:hypothetical protein
MAFNYSPDSKRAHTINPADLHTDFSFSPTLFDQFCQPDASILPDLSAVDSAVDLTSFQQDQHRQQWSQPVKLEPLDSMDQFLDLGGESSLPSNTPSPTTDMIFSNANSPGDFVRDLSQTSSPETSHDIVGDVKPEVNDTWKSMESMFSTPDVIHIPQTVETPQVYLNPDKTKTRAETQIKVQLILDPLDERFEHIHFPRKTLAKPKLLASSDEKKEIEAKGEAVHMELYLVCATAVEKRDRLDQALRRARGEEAIPRRQAGLSISEMEKDDPAHPQNGGEVLICEGCKERERKRYDRKKKRAEDEDEWWGYEADRVIMINEKEYKKWKDIESGDQHLSPRAKQVEFAMRIACYCRHQEEKSPVGYRVIFTFKDAAGRFIAQHTSEIFQITDDHKNKDIAPEAIPRPLHIPQSYVQTQYGHASSVVPLYQYPVEGQYAQPAALGTYSQPQTPIMSNFQTPMSPMDTQFPQSTTPTAQASRQAPPAFPSASVPSFPQQQRQSYYDAPLLSPTGVSPEASYLPRPISMDNFNYTANMQHSQHQGFASAPPSAVSTPINLSRPASPTWEQGPNRKRLHCVYFYVDDEQ